MLVASYPSIHRLTGVVGVVVVVVVVVCTLGTFSAGCCHSMSVDVIAINARQKR